MPPGRAHPLLARGLASAASSGLLQATACLEEVRGVIRVSGAGVVQFLQGLVTNDVLPLEAPGAAPRYACVLNAQGRHLHDLFLHRTQDAEPTLLLDCDAGGKEDLLRLLKRYRLRQKLGVEDVSGAYRVWASFGGDPAAVAAAAAAAPPGWVADPRLPELGLRAVLPADGGAPAAASSSSGGGGSGSSRGGGWQAYRRWRIVHGVAEGDAEIPSGEVIPLEFNLDGLRGICFTKGCYVGQELMARTHFKGVVRKRLMPFMAVLPGSDPEENATLAAGAAQHASALWELEEEAAAEAAAPAIYDGLPGAAAAGELQPGAAVYVEQEGGKRKGVGTVRVSQGSLGLAVLRLAAVDEGLPLLVGEGEMRTQLVPWRPQWWPDSWGSEGDGSAADA